MGSEDRIDRLNAALEGRYRIERGLGEGGMATVYLADDLRHERKVALKVLKPELAAAVGADRFLAEIKTTANLQHPHALPLHDSGAAGGFLFYVMPYVEGESLRDRLDRDRQLPIEESVRIATSVAEALDHAHRRGVVHRDIKPANILIHDGQPVISDFGIALAVTTSGAERLTETGLSLGTPHYMSPEQATGEAHVGPATDIYALGCVLYEMLVGEPPYTGSTPQAILGRIIQATSVSASEARSAVPAHVDAAIRKALEKVPADRFVSASDFAAALSNPGFRYGAGKAQIVGAGAGRWSSLAVAVAAVAGLLVGVAGWALLGSEPPRTVSRQVLSTEGWDGLDAQVGRYAAIAPDGSSMILPVGGRLGLKMQGSAEVVPIAGTEGARDVHYSPDGASIAYAIGRELFKQTLVGGTPIRLAGDAQETYLALDWPTEGEILYEQILGGPGAPRRIVRIPADGGETVTVFEPDGVHSIAWVDGLPDGRGALVIACPSTAVCADRAGLYIADARDGSYERVLDGVSRAWYVPTGHIMYVDVEGTVFAHPFDLASLRLTGAPVPLFDGVRTGAGSSDIRVSAQGTVLYVEGTSVLSRAQQLVVIDLDGNEVPLPLAPRPIAPGGVGWSPDGRSIVYESEGQIYTYDVVLNSTPRRITSEGTNATPAVSPDGSQIVFSSVRRGTNGADLFVKNLTSEEPARSLGAIPGIERVMGWPADTLIVFTELGQGTPDLWMLDISDPENPEPRPYLTSEAGLTSLIVSPDGTLGAYASYESERPEVHVRSFPQPGERTIVSRGGGIPGAWSADGATLYYTGPGGVVAAHLQAASPPIVVGADTILSALRMSPFVPPMPGSALHPDGSRFITARTVGGAASPERTVSAERLILIENFFEELQERVGR